MNAPEDKYFLAIDLGTSGPKVGLVTATGEVAAHDFEPTPVRLLGNNGAEQDPELWWQAIKSACRRLLARSAIKSNKIAAVSCTAQWSGTVAVNSDGQPLCPAIIWMDARGASFVREITRGFIPVSGYGVSKLRRWLHTTGGIPGHSGKDPIAHILFIKNEMPEIYAATYKFLEPKDYLNLRLTGQFAASYDSITLHWLTDNRDIHHIKYDPDLCQLAGISPEKLPDLKAPAEVLGPLSSEAANDLGLVEDTPVVVGAPDVQSAAVGSGAVLDFEGHLYLGTSSWLTCHVPFKKTDLLHNMASLPAAIPGKYLVANTQESAGASLNFLKDNILLHDDEFRGHPQTGDPYELMSQIAERVPPGSERLIFTPWLYGERTPVEDATVRGGFHNLSLNSTRAHIIRAVYEGVALNSKWLLGYVERFIGKRFSALNLIGGGANSRLWCQIHADVLDRPIRQVEQPILANVRGAAFLAAMALGKIRVEQISELVKIREIFQPNPENRTVYDQLFRAFVAIYKKNKGIYRRLNRSK